MPDASFSAPPKGKAHVGHAPWECTVNFTGGCGDCCPVCLVERRLGGQPTVHFVAGRFALKDSGEREDFAGGSVRDTREGKGRYDLISPLALRRIAQIYEAGAAKYGDRNWEKGQPIMRFLDSAIRHLLNHIEGLRDEDHLSQAAWNILGAIHTEEAIDRGVLSPDLDDRPDFTAAG